MNQVVTIHPDGAMSGLQVKSGKGLNLQSMGHAQTKRASEIVWDEAAQAWKIDVLQDAGKGVVTLSGMIAACSNEVAVIDPSLGATDWRVNDHSDDDTLLFSSYDDAVKVEIAYLDALRLKGQF